MESVEMCTLDWIVAFYCVLGGFWMTFDIFNFVRSFVQYIKKRSSSEKEMREFRSLLLECVNRVGDILQEHTDKFMKLD